MTLTPEEVGKPFESTPPSFYNEASAQQAVNAHNAPLFNTHDEVPDNPAGTIPHEIIEKMERNAKKNGLIFLVLIILFSLIFLGGGIGVILYFKWNLYSLIGIGMIACSALGVVGIKKQKQTQSNYLEAINKGKFTWTEDRVVEYIWKVSRHHSNLDENDKDTYSVFRCSVFCEKCGICETEDKFRVKGENVIIVRFDAGSKWVYSL